MKAFLTLLFLLVVAGARVSWGQTTADPCASPAPYKEPKVTRLTRVLAWLHLKEKPLPRAALDSLRNIDALLTDPFADDLITASAYSRLRYRNIVSVGGFNIKQGHAAGTSLTVDDKGGTLNVGLVPVADSGQYPRLALQGTVKATADNGLATIFSGGDYQNTLGFGGGVLYFFQVPAKYNESAKKRLQLKYTELKKRDSLVSKYGLPSFDSGRSLTQAQKKPASLPQKWQQRNAKALQEFVAKWLELQKKNWSYSYYKIPKSNWGNWAKEAANKRFMTEYWQAEDSVRNFLPAKWDGGPYDTANEEKAWILQFVSSCEALNSLKLDEDTTRLPQQRRVETLNQVHPNRVKIDSFLAVNWRYITRFKTLRSSLKRIESLQDSVVWHKLPLRWLNANCLFNNALLPIYKTGGGASDFVEKQRDYYWTGQITFNWLDIKKKSNWYWTAGIGAENRRPFDPKDLQTYQTASPAGSGSTVQVIEQKQLYPTFLNPQFTLLGLAGATYYHHGKVEWGISANFNQKMFGSHQSLLTFGIFTPVKAGATNILLMPLVRYDTQGIPNHWVIGVSLTTTFPAFLTTTFPAFLTGAKKDK